MNYEWTRNNWNYIQSIGDIDTNYYTRIVVDNDSMVVLKLLGKGFGFRFEEIYKNMNGKWYLIYLVDYDL